MEEKKSVKISIGTLICTVIIIILLIAVGILYLKVENLSKNEDTKIPVGMDNKMQNAIDESIDYSKSNSSKSKIEVIDGISFIDTYCKKRNIRIPQICNGGENATKLNKKMAEDILSCTYGEFLISINDEVLDEPGGKVTYEDEKLNVTYNTIIKNDILIIVPKIEYTYWPATGSGISYANYYYDIKNDKVIEKMSQVLQLLGYSETELSRYGAKSFSDFDDRLVTEGPSGIPLLKIENNELKIDIDSESFYDAFGLSR